MSYLFEDKAKNSWTIYFYDANNRRKSISLQRKKFNEKTARIVLEIIEHLEYCRNNSIETPSPKILNRLEEVGPVIRKKLVKAGLYGTPEEKPKYTCQELWEGFMKAKTGIKESTLETYENSQRRFFLFFEGKELLADLTTKRMEEWKAFLQTHPSPRRKEPLKEATIASTLLKTRAVFNWAKKQGWVDSNPVYGFSIGSFVNKENERHITMDEYFRLLEYCPSQEWRVIVSLARIGGLRSTSEIMGLRWSDIHWDINRFYVRSPKTEQHRGKAGRLVPIFPELRKELEDWYFRGFDNEEPTEFVINQYRDKTGTCFRKQFRRIAEMAGFKDTIPRAFCNMRASRSTEIYAEFGPFLESLWIGHSTKIAMRHYLQVRDEDFARAAVWECKSGISASVPRLPNPLPNRGMAKVD